MKIKIRVKILGCFLLLTVIIAFMSIKGLSDTKGAKEKFETLIESNLSVKIRVIQVGSKTYEQVSAIRGYMLYQDEKYHTLYNDLTSELDQLFMEIKSYLITEESNIFLNKLIVSEDNYDTLVQSIFNLIKERKNEEALLIAEDARIYVDEMKQTITEWSHFIDKINDEIANEVDSNISNNQRLTFIIVVISIFISLGLGLFLTQQIAKPINKLTAIANAIAAGDLTQNIHITKTGDEIEVLSNAFSIMLYNLRDLIHNINNASEQVASSSEELAASSEEVVSISEQIANTITDLATSATEQAQSIDSGNGKIIEISEGLIKISSDMNATVELTKESLEKVRLGENSVELQKLKMNEMKKTAKNTMFDLSSLSEESKKIEEIVGIIKGISDQTNLLSLNATIESARAGEHGKGFMVVANEVRKLSEQTNNSVIKVGEIIKTIKELIHKSVMQANKEELALREQEDALIETVKAFQGIQEETISIVNTIHEVTEFTNHLNKRAMEVTDDMNSIASIAQEAAASTEEVSASTQEQVGTIQQIASSAEELANIANEMQSSIQRFNL